MEALPTIKPLINRVVVKRLPAERIDASGIVRPDVAMEERPQLARVLSVGPWMDKDYKPVPCEIKEGDIVVFGKYSYSEISLKGQEFLVLRNDEIWGVVQDLVIEEEQ